MVMNMPVVLLYNLSDAEKAARICFVLFKLGLPWREVRPEEFSLPVGRLAGIELEREEEEAAAEPFTGEMLVLCGLSRPQFGALLDQLRQARAPVALKAVLTEHNARWSSHRLYRELSAEHEAMKGLAPRQAKKNSRHKS